MIFQFKNPLGRKIKITYWICSLIPWHRYLAVRLFEYKRLLAMITSGKQLLLKSIPFFVHNSYCGKGYFSSYQYTSISIRKYLVSNHLDHKALKTLNISALNKRPVSSQKSLDRWSRAVTSIMFSDPRLLLALLCVACPRPHKLFSWSRKAAPAPAIVSELQPSGSWRASHLLYKDA